MADFQPTYPSTDFANYSNEELDAFHKEDGKLRLFNNISCPFGQRALWTAIEVNAPFEVVEVSLANMPDSYAEKFNRYWTVPYLLDNGFPVYESAIVAQYLDAKYNNGALFRRDDPKASSLAQLVVAKFEARPFYVYTSSGDEKAKEEVLETVKELETIYSQNAKAYRSQGPYLLGAELSSAEIIISPFLYRFEALLSHYRKLDIFVEAPVLKAAFEAVKAHPTFQRTIRPTSYHIEQYASRVKNVD
ncbi:hypothetical protein LEN26_005342 [Aphanomyces euteiches]|nr:hypothetical protein AeMF1_003687 [Aphanomyces euteiches]KAH9138435.1 hypothetical protein LEN26_005342 [Aphanomyces euteiches]KAH9189728.1 hypothetical protein AeNC1_008298 [Aphanomyces euteiches]